MKTGLARLVFLLLCFGLTHQDARAAAIVSKVVMTTGSLSERKGVVYVAQDLDYWGLFPKETKFVPELR